MHSFIPLFIVSLACADSVPSFSQDRVCWLANRVPCVKTNSMQIKSLPLAVWVLGGAVLGYIVVFLALTLLKSLAVVIGPILGALWGYSLYRRRSS